MTRVREWIESPIAQGADEQVRYALDVSAWGTNPTGITVVAYDEDRQDVSSTVLSGSASLIDESTILLPTVKSLTADTEYRIEVKFTIGGQVLECYGYIRGEL